MYKWVLKICGILLFSVLALLSEAVRAEQWVAPNVIQFSGANYKLAYKQDSNPQQQLYEYTSHDESIEKWSSLFSIVFSQGPKVPLSIVAANIGRVAMARSPKPQIKIYGQGDYLINRVIYDFTENSPSPYFESNARKIFYSESCQGFFDISIAYKIPNSVNVNSTLVSENEALTNNLLAHTLKPECLNQKNTQPTVPSDAPLAAHH
jgi:hypothetical protein